MEPAILKIVDVLTVPGRAERLAVFEIVHGSYLDFVRSSLFSTGNPATVWRLAELAHVSPPPEDRQTGGFLRVTGDGELVPGMELVQVEAKERSIAVAVLSHSS